MGDIKERIGEVLTNEKNPLGEKVLGIKFPFTITPIKVKVYLRLATIGAKIDFKEKEDEKTDLNFLKNIPLIKEYIATGLANGNKLKYWIFKNSLKNRNGKELITLFLKIKEQSDPTVFFYLLKAIKMSDQILVKSEEAKPSLEKSPAQKKS